MLGRLKQLISVVMAALLLFTAAPIPAFASIFVLPDNAVSSPTNPGAINDYSTVWREGWGNDQLPEFDIVIPSATPTEPAIVGGYYYVNRPASAPASMHAGLWPQSYWSPVTNATTWRLFVDIPSEVNLPGGLFNTAWVPPVVPTRAFEGPFVTYFQFVAKDTTDAARGAFAYGIDVTPPSKVTGLKVIPGVGAVAPSGWLTQSRAILTWDDKVYDSLSGTGYFEAFIDGKPYPVSAKDQTGRRVFDLKEHYPGYGFSVNTKREMVIEDLPAGSHTLQIRAVDRATNEGPLSDPVVVKVDPDMPTIEITAPEVDGQTMGAKPTFKADVTDKGGVASVAFSVDGVPRGTDLTAPYELTADLSAFADGSSHTLRVTATDLGGRTNYSEKVFVIDKKPTLQLISPNVPGESFPSLVPLKASYGDKTGVTGIVFRVDGAVVSSMVPASSNASAGVATVLYTGAAGLHTMSVTVTNDVGGVATANGSFTVNSATHPDLAKYATKALALGESPIWYNTEFPTFTAVDTGVVTDPAEVLYLVDRAPMTVVDPTNPNAAYASFKTVSGTTYFTGVIDQNGVYLSNPVLFDGRTQLPGAATPTEGLWYTHALVRDKSGNASDTVTTVYGVDLTPPGAVTGLSVWANLTTPAVGWLQQTRAIIKWDGTDRDALSGTASYNVYVDGELLNDSTEPIAFQPGRGTMQLTLEDLTPGAHTVYVTAVDKAGNESAKSDPLTVRIFSKPVVAITSPASVDATLPTPAPLRATITDAAGIATVQFAIDGVVVKTFSPSAGTLSMVGSYFATLSEGPHDFTVTATSVSGPSTVASRRFIVDTTLPPVIDPPPDGGGGGGGTPVVTPTFTWFNTAYPSFTAQPSGVPTVPTEMLYLVDRNAVTPIDPLLPNLYYGFFNPVAGNTYFNGLIDQMGVYLSDPVAFDGATQMPGRVTSPIEGVWYIHALVRDAEGAASPITHVGYGVDLTKPAAVTGVSLYANSTALTPIAGWMEQNRVVVRWNGSERDALSGTAYYKVYVDGRALGADKSIAFQRGRATMSLTIENLGQGTHTVQVTAVDRAENESALSAPAQVTIDSSAPTVEFLTPGEGAASGAKPYVSVAAADSSGVARIDLYVDDRFVGAMSEGDASRAGSGKQFFQSTVDLSSWASGNHTLKAVAYDGLGASGAATIVSHTSSTTRSFVLDRSVPVLSSVSGSGYRRTVTVGFVTSKRGTATVNVDGIVKTFAVSPGAVKVALTVPKRTKPKTRRVNWSVSVTDSVGNVGARSGTATVKYYDIVKVGRNGVRIRRY
jgi:hypothetical protein